MIDRRTTARLLAVLSGDGDEDQVALRGSTTLARRLAARPATEPDAPNAPSTWTPAAPC